MNDVYQTIKAPSEGLFKDRQSRFLAFAFPVETEEEVKEKLKNIKKQYHDARHWVYAFVLGADKTVFRYSDDGEPANSSGPPVYNTIKSFDLTNVLVIVVRYFGGKKLGVPGLVNAYKTAAGEALSNAQIIQLNKEVVLRLDFSYPVMNRVMYILKKEQVRIVSQDFAESCSLVFSVKLSQEEKITALMSNIGVRVSAPSN